MYYAWKTASEFSSGALPSARAKTPETLSMKMVTDQNKRFFTALLLDGAWVDLTTYGPGNEDGREVSEERVIRYVRARKRALEATGADEVNQNTPMPSTEHEAPSPESQTDATQPISMPVAEPDNSLQSAYQPAQEQQPQREQVNLAINPAQVKAIYEFLAMDEKQRETAMNALSALSMSADAFKSAIAIMLEPDVDLIVSISEPDEQQ